MRTSRPPRRLVAGKAPRADPSCRYKRAQFETSRVSGHEPEVRSGFRNRANEQRVEFGPAEKDAGSNHPLLEPDPTGLPAGSALIVLERGPNAGSRFLLDQPVTSVGRHPRSHIFLDDVTVSRRHVELRWEKDDFHDRVARP